MSYYDPNDDDAHRDAVRLLCWCALAALLIVLWATTALAGDGHRLDPQHDANSGNFNEGVVELWQICPTDDPDLSKEQQDEIHELEHALGMECEIHARWVWVPMYPGRHASICFREKGKHTDLCAYMRNDRPEDSEVEMIQILPAGEST